MHLNDNHRRPSPRNQRAILGVTVAMFASVGSIALATGPGDAGGTMADDRPAQRVCWHDSDTGGTYGQCWRVTVYEDGSGCMVAAPTVAALDGGDHRRVCFPR